MSSRPSRGAARLAAILDALPDALLLVNCNGTVVNANSIALEVFESPGTALVGRGLLDLLPDFDSKRIPGSMRRPDDVSEGPTKPTRMVARRTDGTKFLVEVTSANLEDGRTPYESSFEAAFADHGNSYTGDELLMLVVRDLTGTLDTEAELARQQRQTEMILRAAAEGVVGVDIEGRIVLVNPSAAQLLGYRASDLGGRKLHPLVHHSRADGSPLPYEETPIADTLRSGRKHRVRGQVLWTKDGRAVPVDLTTAPVRDGDQLVGAVLAFTDRTAYDALVARHQQLLAVLEGGLRGPLEEFRSELTGLAADPAGQLWPEANQILHHLAAGYARMTTLVDNVLSYQRLDAGREKLKRESVSLDEVISAGVEGAVEMIGPGRAQFAVHAPPIDVEVDPARLAQALAHLVADVAGVDATGAAQGSAASGDATIVVAAAQRGDVVRIEVRGPYGGGSPVHEPLVRGIVRRHGGVLQTHQVPGAGGGSAYVLEVPVGSPKPSGAKAKGASGGASGGDAEGAPGTSGATEPAQPSQGGGETTVMPVPAQPVRGMPVEPVAGAADTPGAGTDGSAATGGSAGSAGTGGGGAIALPAAASADTPAHPSAPAVPDGGSGATPVSAGTGRRRARRALAQVEGRAEDGTDSGEHAVPQPPVNGTTGHPVPQQVQPGTGRRALRTAGPEPVPVAPAPAQVQAQIPAQAPAPERRAFALPPAADHTNPPPQHAQQPPAQAPVQEQAPVQAPFPEPEAAASQTDRPTGRRRRPPAPEVPQPRPAEPEGPRPEAPSPEEPVEHGHSNSAEQSRRSPHPVVAASPILGGAVPPATQPRPQALPMPGSETAAEHSSGVSVRTLGQGVPYGQQPGDQYAVQHTGQQAVQHSGEHTVHQSGQHAIPHPVQHSGQHAMQRPAVPAPAQEPAPASAPAPGPVPTPTPAPATSPGPGRRRKLAAPPEAERATAAAGTAPVAVPPPHVQPPKPQQSMPAQQPTPPHPHPSPVAPPAPSHGGREFAVGAPESGVVEGPELLEGPNGAAQATDGAGQAMPLHVMDDELPPEPLDNPRRLLVWPEPDVSTQQALTDRGYRPVIVNSREEVDAQIAAYPAALFVDPLTGPITRTALQSLRQAAVAAEVPVLVTAGLGQASREAAYGADPAVLLKALAPRDSEQHPPRVLLVEEHAAIADAFAATLERRGMQAAHASSDADAVQVAAQIRPNLVVMDLMQVRRRRAGIIDWLRVNGMLNRTPFVVYTSVGIDPAELHRLASGETVLFLAERSTSAEVQARIVDLLAKIGAH